MNWEWVGPPIDVRSHFPVERRELLGLLTRLDAKAWERPTVCPGWNVHDVVSHIVHDYIRRLSGTRDMHESKGFRRGEDLPAFLSRVNEEFVEAARRWSPEILVDLIAHLGPQVDRLWADLDIDSVGENDVAWVAPGDGAPVWLDVARELSEFWVHQQQIRDALGSELLHIEVLNGAVVDTLIRGLPLALAGAAFPGARVCVQVVGEIERTWTATRRDDRWHLEKGPMPSDLNALVRLPEETFWRSASRGIDPDQARAAAVLVGDAALGDAVLGLVSVIR